MHSSDLAPPDLCNLLINFTMAANQFDVQQFNTVNLVFAKTVDENGVSNDKEKGATTIQQTVKPLEHSVRHCRYNRKFKSVRMALDA